MKVVGLLSGGKDSCYNLCHCAAQGHEIVALASLRPEGGKEEIDSYLYQTVGQDGLHFIAEAFDLPLYRRVIRGTAVDQGSDYASTSKARQLGKVEGDETEDLYGLLQDVLAEHPDIKGVSVGAILSNYQRVRVEHVCARLGLQSLSYLWQYDQSQLLEDMAEAGMECIIIKVAGAGLGLRHLGQNVCSEEMRNTLENLKNKWGTHPAGEGGEYETFTIDCPLFKRRIEITDQEQVVLSSSDPRYDIGTVAYLRIKKARLATKSTGTSTSLQRLPIPELLDQEAQSLLLIDDDQALNPSSLSTGAQDEAPKVAQDVRASPAISSVVANGPWIYVGNITSKSETAQEQMAGCFEAVKAQLAELDMDLPSIAHVNLYLSSMSLFLSVNAVYNTFFGPSPPTRACVACPLDKDCHVKMDIIAYNSTSSRPRSALHVRGLSYWAPANIGPYSQAVRSGEHLFIAGQIGLIPATLRLPEPASFAQEAALSTQHVRRIVKAVQEGTGGGFTGRIESCICWVSGPAASFSIKRDLARQLWRRWQSESIDNTGEAEIPFLIVQASELPKGAQLEWQVTWATGSSDPIDDDEEVQSTVSAVPISKTEAVSLSITTTSTEIQECGAYGPSHVRYFYISGGADVHDYRVSGAAVTHVPVLNLATFDQDTLSAAAFAIS